MSKLISSLYFALFLSVLFLITGCSRIEGPTAPEETGEQSLLKLGGNLYQAVADPGITWSDARTAAAAMKRRGCVGHLATITSQEENDFIAGTFPEAVAGGYWLGGFQPPGSEEPGGGWEWITGEPFIFTNWADGEPNDARGDENALHFFPPFFGGGTRAPGTWNDQNEDNSANLGPEGAFDIGGYVVEFDCDVVICHKPGTPAAKTLVIPIQALAGHLGHGDTVGACN